MQETKRTMQMSPEELLHALNFRYATKVFDPKRKIDEEMWEAIEKSLVLTPSSFGLQPWRFLVVKSEETRERLKAASWGQGQVTDASHFIVFAGRNELAQEHVDEWIRRLAEVQGTLLEKLAGLSGMITGFLGKMDDSEKQSWSTRQVYIALGQLMLGAALLGLDACPLEGISPVAYDEILGLKGSGYGTVVACALGYRSADDKYADAKKARFLHEQMVEHV